MNCEDAVQGGPAMVLVVTPSNGSKPYCIDSTEVTREQYKTFLAQAPVPPGQPAPCDGNSDFTPTSAWPPNGSQKQRPVVGVDLCDAAAFCAWAGKRLCGAIGAAGTSVSGGDNASVSQWLNACSNGGALDFPYGDAYDGKRCNGSDYGKGDVMNVAATGQCIGGVPGLHDMSGNVREWEDACDDNDCRVRGGAYNGTSDDSGELWCASSVTQDRLQADAFTGFRCCRD